MSTDPTHAASPEHELVATDSAVVSTNRWMTVREDKTLRHDGARGIYGIVEKPDFALIIPYADGGFHVILATGLTAGEPHLEETESGLISRWFPEAEVWELVAEGRLKDAPTLAALALFQRHRAVGTNVG